MRNVVPMLLLALSAGISANKDKFLILASPRQGLVQYAMLTKGGAALGPLVPLLTVGITTPEGLATDGNTLYIADPGDKVIYAVDLEVIEDANGKHLVAQRKRIVVTGVESNWVASGSKLLYTDIAGNAMWEIPDPKQQKQKLYMDGTQLAEMSNPGGLAAEKGGSVVYFANTVSGTTAGSIVAAIEDENGVLHMKKLASNVDKVTAMCVSQNNVFYTSGATLWAATRNGQTAPVEISRTLLVEPRGCAYDGSGSIFVMDRGAGKVYTVPGNMASLAALDMSEFEDKPVVGENSGILVYEHDPTWQEPASIATEGWKDVRRVFQEYMPW